MADGDQAYWNRWLDTINRSQGKIAPTGRLPPAANDIGPPDTGLAEWQRWLDTLRRNMGSSMPFKSNPPLSNINEVTPNASNIPPEGTPPWQDLLGDQRMPLPANANAAPSPIGTTLNSVSRFLPPWAQAGIAAGRVMWPTPTAPPSMDEAPQWSWPRQ